MCSGIVSTPLAASADTSVDAFAFEGSKEVETGRCGDAPNRGLHRGRFTFRLTVSPGWTLRAIVLARPRSWRLNVS